MDELALPGVEHSLDGSTLTISGEGVTPENLEKVKEAMKGLGFGCKEDAA